MNIVFMFYLGVLAGTFFALVIWFIQDYVLNKEESE